MNVSLQNIDKVSALLTVKLEKADYQEKVEKSLKNIRQKAQMPGFRPGMVPAGLVKKMYGKSVLAEEVNKVLSETVYKYIQDNKINILGEPLPNEDKQPNIDFDTMEEFEFLFDIALAPEFKVEVSNSDKVDYYNITITDEMVESQVASYTQRNGKYEKVDAYGENNDMVKGLLAELDENGNTKEGGIQIEGASMMPGYMKNEEQKAIFANAKVNDVLVFNPNAAWDGNVYELSSLLKIEKDAVADMKSNFSFQVEEISRFVPGELNEEIFNMVFGEGVVKSADEFRAKIKESIAAQFVADSDFKFLLDARKVLAEKVGKLEFPDALLKKIMLLNNQDKGEKFVEENYDKSIEELTWHLIKEQLVKANNIKVEQVDINQMAKDATRAQFAQYGMLNVPEDLLENYAKEMLKKKEGVENLVNRAIDMKLAAALKTQVTLENKEISVADFNKLFE
ncbi:MAG: trigger factor [Bacteroides sp.]|nr:trigger factor [Bacteroides sp.]MBO5016276.1 trigger factor [Bacteroidaceae bacterium]